MSSPISYDLQGQGGGVTLSAGQDAVGNFRWLQVVNDTVLADTASNIINDPLLWGITIPAGVGIGGRFTYVAVQSGKVILYRA